MPRVFRLLMIPYVLLSAVFLLPISVAQEKPAKPEQTGLSPLGDPVIHTDDPAFAFAVPDKKKLKEIRERWRIVDLELRKNAALENIERATAQEKGKETPDDQRLLGLQSERANVLGFYSRAKILLEVDGDAQEWFRIDLQTSSKKKLSIADAQPRKTLETKWSRVQILQDEETTTTADRKRNRQSHILVLKGTPENSKDHGWWRIETRLIPSKDGTQLFQLTSIYRMPAERFEKNTMMQAELLSRCWIIP